MKFRSMVALALCAVLLTGCGWVTPGMKKYALTGAAAGAVVGTGGGALAGAGLVKGAAIGAVAGAGAGGYIGHQQDQEAEKAKAATALPVRSGKKYLPEK